MWWDVSQGAKIPFWHHLRPNRECIFKWCGILRIPKPGLISYVKHWSHINLCLRDSDGHVTSKKPYLLRPTIWHLQSRLGSDPRTSNSSSSWMNRARNDKWPSSGTRFDFEMKRFRNRFHIREPEDGNCKSCLFSPCHLPSPTKMLADRPPPVRLRTGCLHALWNPSQSRLL